MKKLTIEYIRSSFKKEGYILLTTEYKNSKQKLELICPNKHTFSITWKNWSQNRRCKICSTKRMAENQCLKYLDIKKTFENEGCKLLSTQYLGAKEKLDCICPNGHKYQITWNSWQQGVRCKKCYNKKSAEIQKFSTEFVKSSFKKEGYILLTTEYKNSNQNLRYICPKGHRGSITIHSWRQGHRCLHCFAESGSSKQENEVFEFVKSIIQEQTMSKKYCKNCNNVLAHNAKTNFCRKCRNKDYMFVCIIDGCTNKVKLNGSKCQHCEQKRKLNFWSKKINHEGQRFGRLVVLERTGLNKDGRILWKCKCDCGNEKVVSSKLLVRGYTRSCGCLLLDKLKRYCQECGKLLGNRSKSNYCIKCQKQHKPKCIKCEINEVSQEGRMCNTCSVKNQWEIGIKNRKELRERMLTKNPSKRPEVKEKLKKISINKYKSEQFIKSSLEKIKNILSKENYELLTNNYKDRFSILSVKCPIGHIFNITWEEWLRGNRCGQNLCVKGIQDKIGKRFGKLVILEYITDISKWKCKCDCGNIKFISTSNIKRTKSCGCVKSFQENEVFEFVKTNITKDIVKNDREIISPLELDIIIPDKKVAIEYDGLYWHSELAGKDKKYHLDKLNKCKEQGYRLITIFEDEWIQKKDIVKSRLKNILGSSGLKTVYARKCEIREIEVRKARLFCNKHHIQGYGNSKIKLGAFYNNELVSIMTFSKPSLSKGQKVKKEGIWELNRFCSKTGYRVIGVASKLLKHFEKKYTWNEIYSYADRRWSNGNLYEKIGFKLIGDTPVNYWYFKNGDIKRLHRFGLRKQFGESKNITEWQIRQSQGWNRIWDCGNLKYEKINNNKLSK